MRRFRLKEPADGMFVGPRDATTVGDGKFIAQGGIAVFKDESDPRIPSIAANPCFEELDENDEVIEYVAPQPVFEPAPAPPPPPAPEPEPVVTFDYPTVSVAEPVEAEPEETPEAAADETPAEEPDKPKKRRSKADDAESEVGAA